MASDVSVILDAINPYRLWQTSVYNNISGFDNHAYDCYDCIGYLHYANRYDIVISALDSASVALTNAVQSPVLFTESNSKKDAVDIVNDLMSLYCYAGVHVIERYVDEWTNGYLDTRMSMTVGD